MEIKDKVLQQAVQSGVASRNGVLWPATGCDASPLQKVLSALRWSDMFSQTGTKIDFLSTLYRVQKGVECSEIMPAFTQQSSLIFGTDTFSLCDKREVERHDSSLEVMAKVAVTHIWSCSGLQRDESRDTQVVHCFFFSLPACPRNRQRWWTDVYWMEGLLPRPAAPLPAL